LVGYLGAKRVILGTQLLQGFGFLGYLIVTNFATLAFFALLVMVGQSMYWSAYFTLVDEVGTAEERDRWYGLVAALRASGVGLGNFLAGLIVAVTTTYGYNLVVIFNGASFFFAAGLVLFGVREAHHQQSKIQRQGYAVVLRDTTFLLQIVANTCFTLCYSFFYLVMSVYFKTALQLPIWFIGVALGLNTGLITIMQTVIVRWLEPFRRTRALVTAGIIWCVWCFTTALALFLPYPLRMPYLLVTVGIQGLAEMIHTPTSMAIAAASSPEALRGRYMAIFQYSFFLANIVAPSLFTFLFPIHAGLPWLVLAGIAIIGSLMMFWIEPHLPGQAVWTR
ncbi:MAG: MFS transporter, partial [Ktedonobacteraceae bacterium]|nr:MFS transporter [Ktedonobacteraceae bacterium]